MTRVTIDGRAIEMGPGTTVAAAILASGQVGFRRSVSGAPRGPLCGMGICFECRVTIDGEPHRRSCQIVCREGMVIRTA
ncbi:MAG TPA: (2Fe-2S)-binding protein [Bryobacteraceae bacterium]|nr:(2Fe-2S)-binding protein [Bryobacteraceae bacterium]